jgi:hypothetical protein
MENIKRHVKEYGLTECGNYEVMEKKPTDVPVEQGLDTSVEAIMKKVVRGDMFLNQFPPKFDLTPDSKTHDIENALNFVAKNPIDAADAAYLLDITQRRINDEEEKITSLKTKKEALEKAIQDAENNPPDNGQENNNDEPGGDPAQ